MWTVGFWKGRETMSGLSSRAVLSSAAQTVIVYLYLLDAEGVNQIILLTYTVSTGLEVPAAGGRLLELAGLSNGEGSQAGTRTHASSA